MANDFDPQNQSDIEENQEKPQAVNPTETAKNIGSKTISAVKKGKKLYGLAKKAQAATEVVEAGATFANPVVLIIILVVIGLFLIYIFFFSHASALKMDDDNNTQQPTTTSTGSTSSTTVTIPGLTITLTTSKPEYENGEDIVYTVSYTYDTTVGKTPLEDIVLYDTIPSNASFVSTTGVQTPDSTTSVVNWSLKDPTNQSAFTITLHPTSDDVYVTNTVAARVIAASSGSVAASTNDCGYDGYNMFMFGRHPWPWPPIPNNLNYGDPNCEVTDAVNNPAHRDLIYQQINSLDPQNTVLWFYCIAYGESTWNPNAYLGASTSGYGAYGLFQMNPTGHGVNSYDAGDVDWRNQIQNAINYNHQVGDQFSVWTGGGTVATELYKDSTGNFVCGHALGPGAN
jgi:hypothetical protein